MVKVTVTDGAKPRRNLANHGGPLSAMFLIILFTPWSSFKVKTGGGGGRRGEAGGGGARRHFNETRERVHIATSKT